MSEYDEFLNIETPMGNVWVLCEELDK